MANILLIHGSCHGAWCWREVASRLPDHHVSAFDLPGHGDDKTAISDITLDLYIDAVIGEIDRIGDGPLMLVGHSSAGVIISGVAERAPEKVAKLVYVCAYAPRNGDSLIAMRKRAARPLILPAIEMAPDGLSYSAKPDTAAGVFYHDCPQEMIDYAMPRLCPEPLIPQQTPVTLGLRYETVPRIYVLCEDDHTIPPEEQERMVADWPDGSVTRLPCGHAPFFTCPETLAQILDTQAKTL